MQSDNFTYLFSLSFYSEAALCRNSHSTESLASLSWSFSSIVVRCLFCDLNLISAYASFDSASNQQHHWTIIELSLISWILSALPTCQSYAFSNWSLFLQEITVPTSLKWRCLPTLLFFGHQAGALRCYLWVHLWSYSQHQV